jgi:site-specific DNA recombinase
MQLKELDFEAKTPKGTRVAVYVRCSTDEQAKDDHYGIKIQEDKGRAFCTSQEGYSLQENHIYKDEGFSGSLPIENRPALKQLFEAAGRHEFDIVIVYKIDRIARNLRVLLNALEDLKKLGIGFRSITEPFDTSSAFGESTVQMVGLFAQLERKLIQERTSGGREAAAKDGKWVMGLPPFGYQRNKATGKLEIVDEEAKAVRQFYKWVADEKLSLREVQRRANDLQISAPKFRVYKKKTTLNFWHKRTLNRILTNEAYTGLTYYRKYKRPFKGLDSLNNPELQLPQKGWIPMEVPQIITPELFERTKRQLSNNREFAKRNLKHDYLFSKLIYCGECGFKMFGGYKPPRKQEHNGMKYYHGVYNNQKTPGESNRCPRCMQYSENRLEPIWDTLKEILKQPKIIFNPLQEYSTKQIDKTDINEQLQQIDKQLAALRIRNDRLEKIYLEDQNFSSDKYHEYKKLIEIEVENLKNKQLKLNQFLLTREEKIDRERSISKLYEKIKERLDNATYEEKAKIIRLFINRINLFAKTNFGEVVFNFPTENLIPTVDSYIKDLRDNCYINSPAKADGLRDNCFGRIPGIPPRYTRSLAPANRRGDHKCFAGQACDLAASAVYPDTRLKPLSLR